MKICTKCGEELPDTLENFKSHRPGKLRGQCRKCWNIKKEQRAKKYYREWMFNLIPAHLGIEKLMCVRCGYDKSIVAIEFHHTDPENKIKIVSALVREVSPWGDNLHKVYDEVDKCEIICSNCHCEEHLTEQTI